MCLETGRSRHSNNWTAKPITPEIIQRIEELAKNGSSVEELLQLTEEDELNELHRKALNRMHRTNGINDKACANPDTIGNNEDVHEVNVEI